MCQVPDADQFFMVADSVEELRALASQFEEPPPLILRRGKREVVSLCGTDGCCQPFVHVMFRDDKLIRIKII